MSRAMIPAAITVRHVAIGLAVLLAVVPPRNAGAEPTQPVAGYGTVPMATKPCIASDLVITRLRDGARRTFALDATGARDTAAIARFLGDRSGRVERAFDRFGSHDLVPRPGTRGPMILAGVGTDGTPGLLFDNDGAFEGDVAAVGRPPYAVSLAASGLRLDPSAGFTIVARLRLGNVVSIAGGQMLQVGAGPPHALALLAGWADPSRPDALSDDLTLLQARNTDLSLPPPSTPSVFALALDRAGLSVLSRGRLSAAPFRVQDDAPWTDLLLGTTQPGAGAGFELDGLLLFDRKLSDEEILAWAARLAPHASPRRSGTLVLDGSSVEAGVGSTGLRNQTRLYEHGLPGFEIDNVAVGGALTLDRIRALPATLRLLRDRPGTAILLCAVGANSLATGVPPAEAYAQIARYVRDAHRALPRLKVGLATLIPNGGAIDLGRGAAFDAYNRLVRENRAQADFIADRAADPVMGDPHRYRPIDPTISADGAHPTDLGHARLAAIDLAAFHKLLSGPTR